MSDEDDVLSRERKRRRPESVLVGNCRACEARVPKKLLSRRGLCSGCEEWNQMFERLERSARSADTR